MEVVVRFGIKPVADRPGEMMILHCTSRSEGSINLDTHHYKTWHSTIAPHSHLNPEMDSMSSLPSTGKWSHSRDSSPAPERTRAD